MPKQRQRQALALSARHQEVASHAKGGSQLALGVPGGAIADLEAEASRIVAEDITKRAGAGTSGHIVVDGGRLSGLIRDAHTTVRFAGGSVAVTTHE